MVLVGGEVDAVNASVEAGLTAAAHTVVDHFVIANLHPSVFPAISGVSHLPGAEGAGRHRGVQCGLDHRSGGRGGEGDTRTVDHAESGDGHRRERVGVDDWRRGVRPGGSGCRGSSHRAKGFARRKGRHRRAPAGDNCRVHLALGDDDTYGLGRGMAPCRVRALVAAWK